MVMSMTDTTSPKIAQTVPVVAVILAAGRGTRFDLKQPKQLIHVGKRAIVDWSLRAFEKNERVSDIVVVVNQKVRDAVTAIVDKENFGKVRLIVEGGVARSDSTQAALSALRSAGIPSNAKLLIHDATRPFVEQKTLDDCIDILDSYDAATVAVPAQSTVILARDSGDRKVVQSIPDHDVAYMAQAPQAFRFGTLDAAYQKASESGDFSAENDLQVMQDFAPTVEIAMVGGCANNIAVVTVADMPGAEEIAKAEALSTVRAMLGNMDTTPQREG